MSYLRDAEMAHQWHANKLIRAYQVHLENFGNQGIASAMLFGGLGYEPPYPADPVDAAAMMLRDQATRLAQADLYVLTPQMCDVVVAAAQTLSVRDLELLDPDDLPSLSGLVVLPYPLLVTTVGGNLGDDRAFSWHTPANFALPQGRRETVHLPAVQVANFHDTYGPVRPDSFLEIVAHARRQGTPLPPLLLDAMRCIPFHADPDDAEESVARLRRAASQVDGDTRAHFEAQGVDENRVDTERVDAEYASGDPIDDVDDMFTVRFLYAFWRLCEQRITDAETAPAGHQATVLSERAGVSPEVRVVRLRQAERSHDQAGTSASREWQHQWVVRMHKVRQWYPTEQRHKVIYRGPYLKGPDDKPLLGGETVRGLVR